MRIFITGPGGSGKSTLARKLAARNDIPFFELDDIHWIRAPQGDIRRSPEERVAMLEEHALKTDWVIEGVQFKWADIAIEKADEIIVVDPSKVRNIYQITLRFIKQFLGIERSKYKPTLKIFCEMIGWFNDYHRYERAMMFEKLKLYKNKVRVIKAPDLESLQDRPAIHKASAN